MCQSEQPGRARWLCLHDERPVQTKIDPAAYGGWRPDWHTAWLRLWRNTRTAQPKCSSETFFIQIGWICHFAGGNQIFNQDIAQAVHIHGLARDKVFQAGCALRSAFEAGRATCHHFSWEGSPARSRGPGRHLASGTARCALGGAEEGRPQPPG